MSSSLAPTIDGRPRVFCAHRASLDHPNAPNSLAAVRACIAAGAPRLEIDVRFLADDAMLIFHDGHLDPETTGCGPVSEATRDSLRGVSYRHDGSPLCYLEDVVHALAGSGTYLQVDLKGLLPHSDRRLARLAEAVAPLGEGVVVGSQAHWNLRPIASRGIPVALDPTLHWHYAPERRGEGLTPATHGRHGLWDDSPLAHFQGLDTSGYLEARIRDLLALVPAIEWMVDYETLLHLDALGLRLGERLSAEGIRLAAWTVHDQGEEATSKLLDRLFALGAGVVITDDATRCARYVHAGTQSPRN